MICVIIDLMPGNNGGLESEELNSAYSSVTYGSIISANHVHLGWISDLSLKLMYSFI